MWQFKVKPTGIKNYKWDIFNILISIDFKTANVLNEEQVETFDLRTSQIFFWEILHVSPLEFQTRLQYMWELLLHKHSMVTV